MGGRESFGSTHGDTQTEQQTQGTTDAERGKKIQTNQRWGGWPARDTTPRVDATVGRKKTIGRAPLRSKQKVSKREFTDGFCLRRERLYLRLRGEFLFLGFEELGELRVGIVNELLDVLVQPLLLILGDRLFLRLDLVQPVFARVAHARLVRLGAGFDLLRQLLPRLFRRLGEVNLFVCVCVRVGANRMEEEPRSQVSLRAFSVASLPLGHGTAQRPRPAEVAQHSANQIKPDMKKKCLRANLT
jgi:hypothetical protein